ncbi:hypothetical protein PSYMO_37272, partial [Pseudomonas amygdali pv. mori str. 301020]
QSGRRLFCTAIYWSMAFLPQDGQARQLQVLHRYLTCG